MIIFGNSVWDWDLDSLESFSSVLDSHLDQLDQMAKQVPDPDSWGIYDRFEEIYGIGFVVGQRYIAAICGTLGVRKAKALCFGPASTAGMTVVQAVNHAANYWKHHDEWQKKKEQKQDADTKRAIEWFGVKIGRDYVLSCVFAALTPPPHRMRSLLPQFEAWREELRKGS